MINAMRMDLRKWMVSKQNWRIAGILAMLYPMGVILVLKGIYAIVQEPLYLDMSEFTKYTELAPLAIGIVVTLFLHAEFQDGVLRNKLISGQKRSEVFLSICSIMAAVAAVMQLVSELMVFLMGTLCGAEWREITVPELTRYTVVMLLSGIAIAVFYSAIYLCHGNGKLIAGIPVGIAIASSIAMMRILDQLYPTSGECSLTGMRYVIYRSFDQYSPFAYITGSLRWNLVDYVLGAGGLILLSIVLGLMVFHKKDLT